MFRGHPWEPYCSWEVRPGGGCQLEALVGRHADCRASYLDHHLAD